MSDFFQLTPEGIFQADAGPVSTNDDGMSDNRRFHWGGPRRPLPFIFLHRIRTSLLKRRLADAALKESN